MSIFNYFPVYKKNLQLAVPVVLAQAGQMSVNLIDTMMVGHVGTTELAASAFANNIFMFGMLFGIGITIGITPLTGQSFGETKYTKVGEWLKNGIFAHLITTLTLLVIMGLITFFMGKMGQETNVVQKAIPYYLLLVLSLAPMLIFFSFKQFLEGIGNTTIAMYITLTSNILNIILNYILIFGKLGCPAMGLNGTGIATLIARLIMPFMMLFIIRKNKKYASFFQLAYQAKLEWKRIVKIFSVGLPIGSQMVIEIMAFAMGAIMMGWISKQSLAAHQVAIGLAAFTYMISFGVASGTTIRVSHLHGGEKTAEMKHVIYASLHLVILFMSLMGISFILLRYQLPRLFSDDPEVIKIASKLLIVGALFQIFDGIQVILISSLRGLADVKRPMLLAFFSYIVVSLPIAYLTSFIFNFKEIGIWLGFLAGLATAASLFWIRINRLLIKN